MEKKNPNLESLVFTESALDEYSYQDCTRDVDPAELPSLVREGRLVVAWSTPERGRRPKKFAGFLQRASFTARHAEFYVAVRCAGDGSLMTILFDNIELVGKGFPLAISRDLDCYAIVGAVEDPVMGAKIYALRLHDIKEPVELWKSTGTYAVPYMPSYFAFMETIRFGIPSVNPTLQDSNTDGGLHD